MTAGAGEVPSPDGSCKRRLAPALVVTAVASLALGGYGAHRAKVRAAREYVPPVFVDPGPGPRAPSSEWCGVEVGVSHLGDVRSTTSSWSLSCADRGSRALMSELREKKRAEVATAEARGAPDAVTGASILTRRTAHDDNPQIRFDCEDASSDRVRDRVRPASKGRLLFVFDDESAPVRHVSYQRSHGDWASALADFTDAKRALSERFGPARESGTPPLSELTVESPLPKYTRREAAVRYSDLVAKVSIVNLGGHGFSVSEIVEVPWPVRADAPAR